MADIFLSYSSADRDAAEKVQAALAAAGYDVFWDQDVAPGADWNTWIGDKLKASSIVIVLWSATSVRSKNVVHEASIADKKKKLIPAYIDDLDVADFPMGFYTVQAVDLRKFAGGQHPGMSALLKAVRGRIGGRGLFASVADTFPDSAPPKKKAPPRRKIQFRIPRLAIGAGALVLGMVFVFGAANVLSKGNLAQLFSSVPLMFSGIDAHKTLQDCDVCPQLVEVPKGRFVIGSHREEPGHYSDEDYPQTISFAKPFAVGKTEVTFKQWDACVSAGGCGVSPSDLKWGRGDRPVINVSWVQAQSYVEWLSKKTGEKYSLPTEAQWEYVARAGSMSPYWWGEEPDYSYANFGDGKQRGVASGTDEWLKTAPVRSFASNPWGLYDTSGNVWEWVQDCWHPNHSETPKDGSAWRARECKFYVMRGGAWVSDGTRIRSAIRHRQENGAPSNVIGFRVVREL